MLVRLTIELSVVGVDVEIEYEFRSNQTDWALLTFEPVRRLDNAEAKLLSFKCQEDEENKCAN